MIVTTSNPLTFPIAPEPAETKSLRKDVRAFLAAELKERGAGERARSWTGVDFDFTRKLGERGWIGMTWPRQYGGHERNALERFVVVEELLAAGAPVAAHWAADRQSGPLLLRFGTDRQKAEILPRIAAGECFFCIGMSEPDAGSDLAAVRTMAAKTDGGYVVNGSKIWTSGADRAHYMILFCRTEAKGATRHDGVSQFLVDMTSRGLAVRPIPDLQGRGTFNEVFFEDVFVPDEMLIGQEGQGWRQVTSELSLERSGPDRFLSAFVLLLELIRALGASPSPEGAAAIGRFVAHVHTLRQMSFSVANMIEAGADPTLQAAVVKDLGAVLEQEIPEISRLLLSSEDCDAMEDFRNALAQTILISPVYSLRGGTREILRGIIAKGLGLR
ncbi:MAG: acyl-CoA dehydrogenase family protein [Hyphomonadaceae bacterium]|nr:acyl-CoA dehydrogenase family protein [Hyphomonadaceae bacterium]